MENKEKEEAFKKLNEVLVYINKVVDGSAFTDNPRLRHSVMEFALWKKEQYKERGLSGEEGFENFSHSVRNLERLSNFLIEAKDDVKDKFINATTATNYYGLKQITYNAKQLSELFGVDRDTITSLNIPFTKRGNENVYKREDVVELINRMPKYKDLLDKEKKPKQKRI